LSRERVVVLAVTKMLSGMCTGGITLSSKNWVRPVKEFGTVLLGDLTYADKTVMQPFDIVDFTLVKPRPRPPHKEDWVCDFVRARPIKVGNLNERQEFLTKNAEPNAAGEILRAERSLALIEPSNIEAVFKLDSYSGKYDARLSMPEAGERPLPVTDIKWRAFGRELLGGSEQLVLTYNDLKNRFSFERIFVSLGLGRMYEGRHWPLVIGVHTLPDYPAKIDYRQL